MWEEVKFGPISPSWMEHIFFLPSITLNFFYLSFLYSTENPSVGVRDAFFSICILCLFDLIHSSGFKCNLYATDYGILPQAKKSSEFQICIYNCLLNTLLNMEVSKYQISCAQILEF